MKLRVKNREVVRSKTPGIFYSESRSNKARR